MIPSHQGTAPPNHPKTTRPAPTYSTLAVRGVPIKRVAEVGAFIARNLRIIMLPPDALKTRPLSNQTPVTILPFARPPLCKMLREVARLYHIFHAFAIAAADVMVELRRGCRPNCFPSRWCCRNWN